MIDFCGFSGVEISICDSECLHPVSPAGGGHIDGGVEWEQWSGNCGAIGIEGAVETDVQECIESGRIPAVSYGCTEGDGGNCVCERVWLWCGGESSFDSLPVCFVSWSDGIEELLHRWSSGQQV